MGASFSPWNTSSSSTTTFGAVFPVESGRKAYVQFTPYLNVTVGDLYGFKDFGYYVDVPMI